MLPLAGLAQGNPQGASPSSQTDSSASPWTASGTRDGIALAYRDDPAANAREVRATTDLPFAARRIFDVVCDQTEHDAIVPPDAVRMRLLRGSWRIEPLDDARARVSYQVMADPGGRIPAWLVRRGALNALPDVIERVKQRLQGEPRS